RRPAPGCRRPRRVRPPRRRPDRLRRPARRRSRRCRRRPAARRGQLRARSRARVPPLHGARHLARSPPRRFRRRAGPAPDDCSGQAPTAGVSRATDPPSGTGFAPPLAMGRERTLQPAETLAALGHEYHHIQQEHQREPERSTFRRRQRDRMERVAERFERLLARWVPDDELAAAWRRFLYEAAPPPDGPTLREPPLFRGHTASGALIEVRQAPGGDYDI